MIEEEDNSFFCTTFHFSIQKELFFFYHTSIFSSTTYLDALYEGQHWWLNGLGNWISLSAVIDVLVLVLLIFMKVF